MTDTPQDPLFYFDFASPNAYLVHRVLPQVERETGAKFRYVPTLLGGLFKLTGNQAPMMAYAGIPAKLAYGRLEMERFIAKYSIDFTMNPHFPVNTLQLMRGAIAAEDNGVFDEYVETMFHFMWQVPRKLDDPTVIAATMAEAGLPGEQIAALAQTQVVKDRLAANTQAAADRGAFGIPSFLVGGELYFGKDRLGEVTETLSALG